MADTLLDLTRRPQTSLGAEFLAGLVSQETVQGRLLFATSFSVEHRGSDRR
jgi:hypothetical protein